MWFFYSLCGLISIGLVLPKDNSEKIDWEILHKRLEKEEQQRQNLYELFDKYPDNKE